jgi:hypothetical protein
MSWLGTNLYIKLQKNDVDVWLDIPNEMPDCGAIDSNPNLLSLGSKTWTWKNDVDWRMTWYSKQNAGLWCHQFEPQSPISGQLKEHYNIE